MSSNANCGSSAGTSECATLLISTFSRCVRIFWSQYFCQMWQQISWVLYCYHIKYSLHTGCNIDLIVREQGLGGLMLIFQQWPQLQYNLNDELCIFTQFLLVFKKASNKSRQQQCNQGKHLSYTHWSMPLVFSSIVFELHVKTNCCLCLGVQAVNVLNVSGFYLHSFISNTT